MSTTSGAAAQNAEVFDFSKQEVSSYKEYLRPGHYWLSVTNAKYVEPDGVNAQGTKKSPYLEVTFSNDKGMVVDKFFVTPKAMEKLQRLYFGIANEKCTKVFENARAVGVFYEKVLNMPKVKDKKLAMIIGGETSVNNGIEKTYSRLGFPEFIIDSEVAKTQGFEDAAFEENTANWFKYVKKKAANISHSTNNVMLSEGPSTSSKSNDIDESDDLPF